MKLIRMTGGLGNQMFIYAFHLEMITLGYESSIFIPYLSASKKYGHQGYELQKVFGIRSTQNIKARYITTVCSIFTQFIRLFSPAIKNLLWKAIGVRVVCVAENFMFYPSVFHSNHPLELLFGTWQSPKYFEHAIDAVRHTFIFQEELLSPETCCLATKMQTEMSVSIHIRRGDYLSSQYIDGFGGICTPEYYDKAINHILSRYENVVFYIFTDDKAWCHTHFSAENSIFVDHNTDKNSWQDMYLMSKCRHNIIANSSFSWWGAWLNTYPDKCVIAPLKWWNSFEHDDVVPDTWIRL